MSFFTALVVDGILAGSVYALIRGGGTIMLGGVLQSLATGHPDPGFATVAAWLLLVVVLFLRPRGLFGTPRVERV